MSDDSGHAKNDSIVVETPDTVTVELGAPDGKAPVIVNFTRDEYAGIQAAALARNMTIKEFLLWATQEESRHPTLTAGKVGSA